MKKTVIFCIIIILGLGLFLFGLQQGHGVGARAASPVKQDAAVGEVEQGDHGLVRPRQAQAHSEYLAKTINGTKTEDDRRRAVLYFCRDHVEKLLWTANPDLSPVRDLLVTATADPSRMVRAAAWDTIRELTCETKLQSMEGVSQADISTMNANRKANRITASALIISELIMDEKVKVLESDFADKSNEGLRGQAGLVLYNLLSLDTEQKLRKHVSGVCQMNLKAWATGK